jgi:uncharacterized protein (DUF305 family)
MKKLLLQISFAAAIIGCNDHSRHEASTSDTLQHAHHNSTVPQTTDSASITQIMGNMMMQMHSMKPTGNNDVDFATMMVVHHQAAVEMAKKEISAGSDSAMRSFAQKVITNQDKEINMMQQFIADAAKITSPDAEAFQKTLNNSMMAMMKETTLYNNTDKDFAVQMIPHHQSAVDMAKAYLAGGKTEALLTLCNNIITAQTKEINWLNEWLTKH